MAFTPLTIPQTAAMLIRRRPVLEQVINSFAPLLEARIKLVDELGDMMSDAHSPAYERETVQAGVPALAKMDVSGLGASVRKSASCMLPLLTKFPLVAENKESLDRLFLEQENNREQEQVLQAILSGGEGTIAKIADKYNIPTQVLNFAVEFVYSPVLSVLAKKIAEEGSYPWDADEIWSQGYCPICGSHPSIGWLDRARLDDKNAFLAGGGGKKHLHCPMCGTDWKFRRLVCPGCGGEGDGVMEILRETGSHGERLDWCTRCQTYCPVVDLRELADIPDMDLMAIGMLHMDMAASGRGLRPLRMSVWNMF